MIPVKPSQIPFREPFGGVQFLVFKAAFSGERVSDCRRWKRHMSENINAMSGDANTDIRHKAGPCKNAAKANE